MMHTNNIQHNIKSSSKNLDEDGLVMLFKDIFGVNSQNKFPNNFDTWTVKKQCDWIIKNIAEFFPNMPQSLRSVIPAAFCQLDNDRTLEKLPEWMDMDKYRRGQKFVQKNYTAITISKVMGLMYIYTFQEELKPIILGAHSHTPYLAFQRYVSNIKRLFSWYDGEPWIKGTKAYKDMQVARGKHLAMRKKVCQMDHEQITAACTFANPWCLDRELLLKDFAAVSSPEKFGQRHTIVNKSPYKPKGINNADLSVTQSCLVVVPLLYPQSVGIHDATDEDLEAFCHIWKCYGYFLGIEDEYNFCRGSLQEIKQRANDFYQYWVIPNFKELTPEWEHTTRCLVEQLNYWPIIYMPYKAMTLIAIDTLNLNMPSLYASLNYTEWIVYKIYKFMFFYAFKFSTIRDIINNIIRKAMDEAANYSAEKLEEIHEKSKKILPDFSITY
ncbi:uncharacterized protein [Temnothorax longispinosus]|uniref:ER-bound oxygenase mpaB/mpaB'/Rubber oxygenase catalytic domain-containing protein n=1 Tax=Temnothorax longispinosus TaxID=300112 RepID=A0A4V3SAP4_9HYME|nr:Uncharacterized protein DBV15_06619 [Temnothorax longispinosus]